MELLADKLVTESYCVVPRPSHRGHVGICHEHAKMISRLFRSVNLDEYRFHLIQLQAYTFCHQGAPLLELELENGHHTTVCVLYITKAGENRWRYVLDHEDMSAEDIHACVRKAFGGKEKIRLH